MTRSGRCRLLAAACVATLAGVAAAGSALTTHDASAAELRKPSPAAARCARAPVRRAGNDRYAFAAVALRRTPVWRKPGRGMFERFRTRNVNGAPTVFQMLGVVKGNGCRQKWFRVRLPARPNGVTGFIRARDVNVERIWTRIVVDLSDRRMTIYRRGRVALQARAAIGTSRTPTPRGEYYVNQRLLSGNAGGPYGPGAIGISSFSNVLQGWTQGGPIAIHGTNQPWLLGRAVSHGCIRVHNRVANWMLRRVYSGTPVEVRL